VLVLGVDTATAQVSVALGSGGRVLASLELESGRKHAEHLAPAIAYLTESCGVEVSQLSAVGVGIGPGLFTGLRVGVTTAKVLAQTLRIGVVGVPSLDLLAYPVRYSPKLIAAVIDARRREVFWALYRSVPGGIQRVSDFTVSSPYDLKDELRVIGGDVLFVGEGAAAYRETLSELDSVEFAGSEFATPSAAALVMLTTARVEREEFSNASDIEPLYLRATDAEPGAS